MRFRYSRWDGSQDPFGPDVAASDALDEMSEELLSGAGAQGALSSLLRRGIEGRFSGTDALRERLRQARMREQSVLNLSGPLEDIAERPRTVDAKRAERIAQKLRSGGER